MSAHTAVVANASFSVVKDESSLPASPSLNIDIPAAARSALNEANATSPPLTPPLLSTSASSSTSFESLPAAFDVDASSSVLSKDVEAEAGAVAVAGGASDARSRRLSQQYFFPNQTVFECAVPKVTLARDLHLKDHPIKKGEFAEYERLYNADSLMTVDGRHMVRLL